MVFDTTTSQGKMASRVHMTIYDSGSLAPKQPRQPPPPSRPLLTPPQPKPQTK